MLSTLAAFGCHLVAIAVLSFGMVVVIPACLITLEDRDVELPAITISVLKLSFIFVNFWYLLVLLLPLDGLLYFMLRRSSRKTSWLATVVVVLPLVLTLALVGFTALAMYVPAET